MKSKFTYLLFLFLLSSFSSLFAQTYYVKADGGNGNGSTWASALSPTGFAGQLSNAADGDTFYVAAGTYSLSGIQIKSTVTIIGGYPAVNPGTVPQPKENPAIFNAGNASILFDINAPDKTIALQGVRLTGASNAALRVTSQGTNLKIDKCEFLNNGHLGGCAIFTPLSENLEINNTLFSGNGQYGTSTGGAIYTKGAVINSSTFENNKASQGGALYSMGTSGDKVEVTNSTFAGNEAELQGGAFSLGGISMNLSFNNNTFINNNAGQLGSTIFMENTGDELKLTGNIIAGQSSIPHIQYGNCDGNGFRLVSGYNIFSDNPAYQEQGGTINPDPTDIQIINTQLCTFLKGTCTFGHFIPDLAYNGGFTPTIALTGTKLADGKAINTLPSGISNVLTDQRGEQRKNPACIGAYEYTDTIPETTDCPVNPLAPAATEDICFQFPASGSTYTFYRDAELTMPLSPSSPVTFLQGTGRVCIPGDQVTVTQIEDSAHYSIWMVGNSSSPQTPAQGTPISIGDNNSVLKWGWQDPSTTKNNFTITGTDFVRIESANIMIYSYQGTQCGDITPRIYKSDGTLLFTGTTKQVCTGNINSYDKVSIDFGCTLPPGDYYMNCAVANRTDPNNFCLGLYDRVANTTGTVNGITVISNISSSDGRFFFTDIAFSISGSSPVLLTAFCPLLCTKPPTPATTPVILCAGESAPGIEEKVSYDTNNTLVWYADTTQAPLASAPVISTVNDGTTPVVTTYYVSQADGPCESHKASITITVNPKPQVITPLDTVCNKDGSFTLTSIPADIPGTWSSSHPSVAAINNSGEVTVFPDKSGDVTFTFTNVSGCPAATTVNITALCGIIPVPRTDECPSSNQKLRPGASDEICFEFRVIPPKTDATYTVYDGASGGSVIADSLTVEALTNKLFCVPGNKIQAIATSADTVYYSVWIDENSTVTSPPVNDTTIIPVVTTMTGKLSSNEALSIGWFDRTCTKLSMNTLTDDVILTSADIVLGNYAGGNVITADIRVTVYNNDGSTRCSVTTPVSYSNNPSIIPVSLGNCILPSNGSYYIQYTISNINRPDLLNDQYKFTGIPTTVTGVQGLSNISNTNCNGSGILFNNLQYSVTKTVNDTIITHIPGETTYVPVGKRIKLTSSCPLSCLGNNSFALSRTQSTICSGDTVSIKVTSLNPVDMSQLTYQWTFPGNNLQMLHSTGTGSAGLKVLPGMAAAPVCVTLTDLCGNSLTLCDTLPVYGGKDASFSGLDNNTLYCKGTEPVRLTPLIPGGIFEGEGIFGDEFDPSSVTGETATITYKIDDQGCISSSRQTVRISQADPLNIEFDRIGTSCKETTDGLIIAHVQGGEEPYTYQWLTSGLEPVQNRAIRPERLEGVKAGSYISRVTDNNGCQITSGVIEIPVKNPAGFELELDSVTTEKTMCLNTQDGKISVHYSGNTHEQEIVAKITGNSLTKELTSRNISGALVFDTLAAGTYQVHLFPFGAEECDLGGNMRSTVTVSSIHSIKVRIDALGASCEGATDGRLTAIIEEGSPNRYEWFDESNNSLAANSANPARLEGIGIGKYISKISYGDGCQLVSGPVDMPIREISGSSLSIDKVTAHNAKCYEAKDGMIQLSYSGNEYEQEVEVAVWTGNVEIARTTSVNISDTLLIDSLAAGVYEVRLFYAGAGECEWGDNMRRTVTVSQPDQLSVSFSAMGTVCEKSSDGYIAASPAGGTAPYSYVWSSINPSWTQEHHSTGKDTLAALPAGEYRCLVNDAGGCSFLSDTIRIEQREITELSIKNIFYDERQRCYGVNNSRVLVTLNPYSTFAGVKVQLTSAAYKDSVICQNGTDTANFYDLAPGIYRIEAMYTTQGCTAAVDTTVEIKSMSQELSIDGNVDMKRQNCLNEPNGEITFTAKGVVSGQEATVIAPDNIVYTLSHISQREEEATYRVIGLKGGSYTLKVVNICGHTAEKTVEITSIEPYRLELNKKLSDTFVECPSDFGRIAFTYSGGNYPDSPIHLEYDSSRTVPAIERIDTRITYTERIVKDIVYVNDASGYPVRDSLGNLLTREVDRIVYDPVIHSDTLWKKVTERIPVITNSSSAEQSGNQFTFSSLNPRTYYIVYRSAEPGCSDSTRLTVEITAPSPVSVRVEALPISCLGYSDGIISIYPHRAGDPEYYLAREDEDPESFSYYAATKVNDTTYTRSSDKNYSLHELIGFKNDHENKKLEKYNTLTGKWDIIQPVTASRRDELGNFFHANGDTIKVPVWSNRHTTDFWENVTGNVMLAGVMTIAGLPEGVYKYTVVDTLYGCIYTDMLEIKLPESALRIDNVVFDAAAAYCDPEKRQIEINVSGGWGEYVYSFKDINEEYPESWGTLWDGFMGGEVKQYNKTEKTGYFKSRILAPAVYELYITDEKGCLLKYDGLIDVTSKITVNVDPYNELRCPNDSLVEVTIHGAGGTSSDYIYKKFERQCDRTGIFTDDCEDVIVPTSPNSNLFNLPAGTHGLFAYETDGDQCGGYVEVTVQNNHKEDYLFFKRSFQDLLCYEDQSGVAEVRVSGANPPYRFYHAAAEGSLQPKNHVLLRDESNEKPEYHYDYYRIGNLAAGKHKLQVEDEKGCTKELEFELKQPEPLVLETDGSPVCEGAQIPVKGNIFAKSVTGGTEPYLYYVSNDTLSTEEAASETFVKNKSFDVDATPGQQFQYYVKDANGCITHQSAQLKTGNVAVEKLDFLASTWRYDSDALLLVDISKPSGADSIVYSFGDDDDKIVVQDKRLYTYSVAGSDSLMSLAGKDLKSVPDSFFVNNFEKVIPDSVASSYTFILLQDVALMNSIKNGEMKNQLVWYEHKIIMTYYKQGCAFTLERDGFMIANSDSLIYNVGNINQKDILNLELSPNPLTDGNLLVTITFGNKVDYRIDFYDIIGKTAAPSIEGKAAYIDDSMQVSHEVGKSEFPGVTTVVVLVTTKRDATSKVLILK
jgi:hypothetical protein